MNFTAETPRSQKTCIFANEHIKSFFYLPYEKHVANHFIGCVVNVFLAITTTLLSTATAITCCYSSRLKASVSYFLVLVLSLVDLGAGMIGNSLFISILASEISGKDPCALYFARQKTITLLVGLSVMT